MNVDSLRRLRFFLWGMLLVAVLTIVSVYVLMGVMANKAIIASATRLEPLGSVPAFDFATHSGRRISDSALAGKVWVADFFFSSCQGVCPKMKASLRDVQKAFDESQDVKLVSFSVDPKRDTIERLKVFAKKWNAKPGRWYFVTGKQGEINKLANKGFMLGGSEVPGEILHSSKFVLVDQQGNIRGYYDGTDAESVKQLIADIRTLRDT